MAADVLGLPRAGARGDEHPASHHTGARVAPEGCRHALEVVRRELDVAVELDHELVGLGELGAAMLERAPHPPAAGPLALLARAHHPDTSLSCRVGLGQ